MANETDPRPPSAFEEAKRLVVSDCRFRATEWRRYGMHERADAIDRIRVVVQEIRE